MSTESKRSTGLWALPLLMTLPLAGAMAFAVLRMGPVVHKLIHVLIKLAVVQ